MNEAIFVVPSVQASANLAFDNLTIPVAISLDPRIPKTINSGVTATGLTIRDVPNPSVLTPKTKKWLPGDFVLKNNTINPIEITALSVDLDTTKFRIYHIPSCVAMSNYFIHVPIDHFLSGLSVPFDPVFRNFLNTIQSQLAHTQIANPLVLGTRLGKIPSILIRIGYS